MIKSASDATPDATPVAVPLHRFANNLLCQIGADADVLTSVCNPC